MDSTLIQMFSLGEIMTRLGQTLQTGCLHVYNHRDSANIFFKDGTIVSAVLGDSEGEKVIKQVLEWEDTRMVWQPNEAPPASFKAVGINIVSYLQPPTKDTVVDDAQPPPKQEAPTKKESSKVQRDAAPSTPPRKAKPIVYLPETSAPPTPTIVKVKAVQGPPPIPALAPTPAKPLAVEKSLSPAPTPASLPVDLAATKTIGSPALARSMREEALVAKSKLVLVSVENKEQRFKLNRAFSLIGRNPACDITLNHSSISRQHCLLHITDRGLHVKDLETTNGTKVNGIALTEGYVNVGDKLSVGHEVFLLEKDRD